MRALASCVESIVFVTHRGRVLLPVAIACVALATGCSGDDRPSAAGPTGDTGTTVFDTGSPGTDTGGADSTAPDGTVDDTASPSDGGGDALDDTASSDTTSDAASDTTDAAEDTTIVVPSTCADAYLAFGTKDFGAGGATPPAFAAAWNAEVAKMTYPGPMLMAFKGTNSTTASSWKLVLGPLQLDGAGPAVKFAGATAEVPFTMGTGISLTVPLTSASFNLRFATDTTTVDLPVEKIEVQAGAGGCTELGADLIRLVLPSSAGSLSFAGSTVAALMADPGDSGVDAGVPGYVIDLLGSTAKKTVAGGVP